MIAHNLSVLRSWPIPVRRQITSRFPQTTIPIIVSSASPPANMSLSALPIEIICMIAERIPTQAGVKAFMMSHRRVSNLPLVRECLYNQTRKSRLNENLLWACEIDDKDLACAMLRLGADIDCSSRDQVFTPLTLAAAKCNAEIVKLLLEHNPSIINGAGGFGDTALDQAIFGGHIEIVNTLLAQSNFDPPAGHQHPDRMMRHPYHHVKPLNEALIRGNEEIVRILIKDSRFRLDENSLAVAAQGGNESLVRLCLEEGHQIPEYYDESPVALAALRGHEAVVKLLLDDGGFYAFEDNRYHRTLLHLAAAGGHDNVAKLLLDRYHVEPNVKDLSDITPLLDAARHGHVDVLKLLLGSGKVIPDARDSMNRTPLSYAAEYGYSEAASLLLATGIVDPDSKDHMGRTPLSWAAENGVADTVRILLQTGRVNPESKDKEEGRTPLSYAAGSSRYLNSFHGAKRRDNAQECRDIYNILQGRADLVSPPDVQARQRGTCGWPAKCDPVDIIEQLLECDEVNPDAQDKQGQTPLMLAAQARQVEAVRLLMATGKVNPELRDNDGWTPRIHAEKGFKPRKLTHYELDERTWDAWEAAL